MKKIYKYPLEIKDDQTIELYGKPLGILVQGDRIVLYAYYDEEEIAKKYDIHISGTGHPVDEYIVEQYSFLGSAALFNGDLIFHIFYKELHNTSFNTGDTVKITDAKKAVFNTLHGTVESVIVDTENHATKIKVNLSTWVDVEHVELEKVKPKVSVNTEE